MQIEKRMEKLKKGKAKDSQSKLKVSVDFTTIIIFNLKMAS